ncbi:NADH:ubiquinone oxidoreductase subunit 3 (subunit A) [Microbacterium resistens]|uniref:NADH:ubiquinone oxidoreductase subunit 3 (Subunit A) n=1 Tax=Microbacterium resistens TaxID=156977 RepID=A0ABU1SD97_9MICO|nr:permease prefix domain 1-containing protein [Microbacterium resistens]MDR6867569.1 NADH:ubiquinone oxidoreductase subunit 3 (subunit A) [Microbacterium resistens]
MNTDIHRLLDEAFAGREMTPSAQDLKEEMRANLVSRVAELEASGVAPADAARRAITELGDIGDLLGETDAAPATPHGTGYTDLALRNRVRPRPEFVVRAVLWSTVVVAGVTMAILAATGVLTLPPGPVIAFVSAASTGLGLLVGDSLSQETTVNHPMPESRAASFALASFLLLLGLGFGGLVAFQTLPLWCIVFAAVGVIAAIVLFAFLGATQTNRRKAWTRAVHAGSPPNRFEEEPETAARFGIYTAVLWLVTLAVIVVLVFTVGWWWAPLAFVGGFAAMMLLLARMLFAPRRAGR